MTQEIEAWERLLRREMQFVGWASLALGLTVAFLFLGLWQAAAAQAVVCGISSTSWWAWRTERRILGAALRSRVRRPLEAARGGSS